MAGGGEDIVVVRRSWPRRLAGELLVLLVALGLLAAGLFVLADSDPGHRYLADRLAATEFKNGLRIRVGRIEGSIFGKATLRQVEFLDTKGVFATSPEIRLDWAPGAWLYRSINIDTLTSPLVRVLRKPALKASAADGRLIPDFDVHIGRLAIARLDLEKAVTGTARVGRLEGSADIRAGRAMVKARLDVEGGDRLRIDLDAEPDADRFNILVEGRAPADGLVPALLGVRQAMEIEVVGAGGWKAWRGRAQLTVAGREAADLLLTGRDGLFRLGGSADLSRFAKGTAARLLAARLTIDGEARIADKVVDGRLNARSATLRFAGRGALDLARSRYRDVRLGIDLLRPALLNKAMGGKPLRLAATLDGAFGASDYSYRLSSAAFAYGDAVLRDLMVEGRGQAGPWPMRLPLRARAAAVTGLGEVAGGILRAPRLEGFLEVGPDRVRGTRLRLESAQLRALIDLMFDLRSGRFDIAVDGAMRRYAIPSLGLVDVRTRLRLVPGADGKARLSGAAEAQVRRLDNRFFQGLAGGLPRVTARIARGPDGILHLDDLRLSAPKLQLAGSGIRRRDGTFQIRAKGRQASYGPVELLLDGPIERPRIDLLLAAPNKTLDVRALRLSLVPSGAGFDMSGKGLSRLGPFTVAGAILLPRGGNATIRLDDLALGGSHARGALAAIPGGLAGRLAVAGGGVDGWLDFGVDKGVQRIGLDLSLRNANFAGEPPVRIGRGRLVGTVRLEDKGARLDGSLRSTLSSIGGLTLGRLDADARMAGDGGTVTLRADGRAGQPFSLALNALLSGKTITLGGGGRIDGKPLSLASPARLTREGDGWVLAPTQLRYAGGSASVSGRSGASPVLHAVVADLPLDLLDLVVPDAGFGGKASGRIDYDAAARDKGRLDLKVRGFSRSGLLLSSRAIDLGIAAVLQDGKAGMRAVVVSEGRTVGRVQARFAPLDRGPLVAALLSAPMQAQLRYAGPADALWRLTGVELFDLSGPMAVGANVGGTLSAPRIAGSVRVDGGRLQSAVTGMVIDRLAAEGRFDGSQLNLSRLSGTTTGGGSVAGGGVVRFDGGAIGLDLAFEARAAEILARDDLRASVSGPIRIRSKAGGGGTISGRLVLDRGRFTLGKAAAAASVPRLAVREVNVDPDRIIKVEQLSPWLLDLDVAGSNLMVSGLGIQSQWRTDLHVGGRADEPRLRGTADLVRGNYDFAGRNFRLERGQLRFRGETPADPTLDIVARAEVQGLDAAVLVQGTGLKPEIRFTSVPALPQEELLSRILFGTSITNLSPAEALQLGAAVASLRDGGGGLDPINAVRRAVGLDRLRIVPADIATGQKTGVAAGKYLTRKLFVEVITDGQGYSATRIEYQITRWLSLLSSVSTIGRTSANVRVSKDY